MRSLIAALAILVSIAGVHAASNIGGPRLGFNCDVNTRKCTCEGIWEGADCQAMKKNCDLTKPTFCSINPPHECSCTLAKTTGPKPPRPGLTPGVDTITTQPGDRVTISGTSVSIRRANGTTSARSCVCTRSGACKVVGGSWGTGCFKDVKSATPCTGSCYFSNRPGIAPTITIQ